MVIASSLTQPLFLENTAIAIGYFDGVHIGHQAVIRAAAEQKENGQIPCVFTFSTANSRPGGKKDSGQVLTRSLKYKRIEQLGIKQLICPDFEAIKDYSPARFVEQILHKQLGAKVLCCGENFHFGKGAGAGVRELAMLCERHGIRLVVVEMMRADGQPVSSTRIRACIAAGDMIGAMKLFGRPHSFDYPVIRGRQLGRTINSPTINQAIPEDAVIPRFGVYASVSEVDGKWMPSVTNIGVKPTVGSERVLAETYILDFSGDLYDRNIEVALLDFIRDEQRFSSVDELKANIQSNARTAREIANRYLFR